MARMSPSSASRQAAFRDSRAIERCPSSAVGFLMAGSSPGPSDVDQLDQDDVRPRRERRHAPPLCSDRVFSIRPSACSVLSAFVMKPPARPVGREGELDLLERAVDELLRGRGSRVILIGEAGIGKSRLATWVVDAVRDAGGAVFVGGAHPFERARPFGAFVVALDLRRGVSDPHRRAIAEVLASGAVPDPDGPVPDVRFRVGDDLVDLFERQTAERSVVLVVEDLHWADPSTLMALRSIAARLADEPLLLCVTARPTPWSPQLARLVEDLRQGGASLIELGPLTPEESEEVARGELGHAPSPLLQGALKKAGGNPLWIVELTRALGTRLDDSGQAADADIAELPSSLRQLVARRLADLPAETIAMLQVAAIVGDSASIRDLARVTGRSPSDVVVDLDEAFRAGLLDEHGERIAFRHQLVHDAIYQELPRVARQTMHRDAAAALARGDGDLLAVADHLVLGASRGDLEAVGWLRAAARDAVASDPSVATQLLERAEALLPSRHADADVVALEIVDSLMRTGDAGRAIDRAEAVLARRHHADVDKPMRLALVSALSLANRPARLIDVADATLRDLPDLGLGDRALVHAQGSFGYTFAGDLRNGEAEARRGLELAEQGGDDPMRVWTRVALWAAISRQGRFEEGLSVVEEAMDIARESTRPETRLRHPSFFLGMALSDVDRLADAGSAFDAALREYEELGSTFTLPDTFIFGALAHFAAGDWASAASGLDEGIRIAADMGQAVGVALATGTRALILLGVGDAEGAARRLQPFEAELRSDRPGLGVELVAYAAAVLAEAQGDDAAALDVLCRAWSIDEVRGNRYAHRLTAPALARLAVAAGRTDLAREVAAGAEADARVAPEVASVRAAAARAGGLAGGDPDMTLAAVDLLQATPRIVDQAGAREDAASVLALAGRTSEAIALLGEALERYDLVGATAWAARVDASLRRLGVRRGARGERRRPATGWASLTPTELAVSSLVANGLTNKEVAGRLFLSPHTVNAHLRHVFAKLGVVNRAGLAAEAARHSV
jgi:DNA-binding CsgD family transcriptional regulator